MPNIKIEIDLELCKKQIIQGYTIKELQNYWKCSRTKITTFKKDNNLIGLSPNSKARDKGEGTKICNICFDEKDINEFYSNGKNRDGSFKLKPACKKCENNKKNEVYYANIKAVLEEQGRQYKCELCDYNKNHAALTFHHYTKEKNFEISSSKTISYDKLFEEILLCKLLCQNCHHEIHNPSLMISGAD